MSLQLSSKKKKAAGGRKRAPIAAAKKASSAPVAKKPEVIEEKKVEPVSLCVYPKSVFCMLRPWMNDYSVLIAKYNQYFIYVVIYCIVVL